MTESDSGTRSPRLESRISRFNRLYLDYKDAVFSFSLYLCRDRREAEDLFQDTWLRVARHVPDECREARLKGWIFTIAANLHRDHLRKKRVRRLFAVRKAELAPDRPGGTADILWTEGPAPPDATERSDMRKAILDAVTSLPQRQRQVFVLKEVAGFRQNEVSAILGIPLGTVKSLMHRAVKNLQKALSDYKPNKVSLKCDVNTLSV